MGAGSLSFFTVEANTQETTCPREYLFPFSVSVYHSRGREAEQNSSGSRANACTSRVSLFSPSLLTARLPAHEMVAFVFTAIFPSGLGSHRHIRGCSFQIS